VRIETADVLSDSDDVMIAEILAEMIDATSLFFTVRWLIFGTHVEYADISFFCRSFIF
jgi:hypothetical protein